MPQEQSEPLPTLPTAQSTPTAHNPELLALGGCPMRAVRTPAGDQAWAATSHEQVRAVYTSSRLGRTHPDPGSAAQLGEHPVLAGPSELYSHSDERNEHTQVRRLLSGYFSARRISRMQPFITGAAEELVDAMAALTPPVDLHTGLSHPLPLRALCRLLGVPFDDRAVFGRIVRQMQTLDDAAAVTAAHEELQDYLQRTVRATRHHGEQSGVMGGLCAAGLADGDVAGMASLLLFAGFSSTAFHIDAGTVLLLQHPEQFQELGAEPGGVDSAVEEVLRLGERDAMGFVRYAREPVELAGAALDTTEAVVPVLSLGNIDETVFADPMRFDINRHPNPHLTFGHGTWHCLGAPLARAVLRTAFTALATRLPGLRLAVPADQLQLCDSGFVELPVTW